MADAMFNLDNRYGLLNHKYLHYGVKNISANWAAGEDGAECVILVTGTHTVTLPDATASKGAAFYVKELSGGGAVATIAAQAGQLIDGAGTLTLTAQFEAALVVSDGANWWILAHNP